MFENGTPQLHKRAVKTLRKFKSVDIDRFFTDISYALELRLIMLSRHYIDKDIDKRRKLLDVLLKKQETLGYNTSSLVLLVIALEFCVYNGMGIYHSLESAIKEIERYFIGAEPCPKDRIEQKPLVFYALFIYALRLHWGFYVGFPAGDRYAALAEKLKRLVRDEFFDAQSGLFTARHGEKGDLSASAFALFADCAPEDKKAFIDRLLSSTDSIHPDAKYFLYFGAMFAYGMPETGDPKYNACILQDLNSVSGSNSADVTVSALTVVFGAYFMVDTDNKARRRDKLKAYSGKKFDIIVQAGQSNAQGSGMGQAVPYETNKKVFYMIDAQTFNVFVSPHGYRLTRTKASCNDAMIFMATEPEGGDFSLSFARRYVEDGRLAKGRNLLIIRSAVGGTGFLDGKWKVGDPLFQRMSSFISAAMGINKDNRLVAFLWHQGETDITRKSDKQTYKENFTALLSHVKEQYKVPQLPFIVGDFVPNWRETYAEKQHLKAVQSALRDLAQLPKGAFVETDGLVSNHQLLNSGDTIHFSRAALRELGERYYDKFCEITK